VCCSVCWRLTLYLLEVLRGAGGDALCALCTLEAVELSKFAEGVEGAGGDALCAYLYAGGWLSICWRMFVVLVCRR